jgi:hypothetical protein
MNEAEARKIIMVANFSLPAIDEGLLISRQGHKAIHVLEKGLFFAFRNRNSFLARGFAFDRVVSLPHWIFESTY